MCFLASASKQDTAVSRETLRNPFFIYLTVLALLSTRKDLVVDVTSSNMLYVSFFFQLKRECKNPLKMSNPVTHRGHRSAKL